MNAANNTLLHEYSYDAWGRMRNTANLTTYSPGSEPVLFVAGRGFTGHEHLPWFNLINMNGRLYDPLTAQFLSPDNYVQDPTFTQNYNRYIYCLNNPLKYVDPSGYKQLKSWEEFWEVINNLMDYGGSWNSETGYSDGRQGGSIEGYGVISGSGFHGPGQPYMLGEVTITAQAPEKNTPTTPIIDNNNDPFRFDKNDPAGQGGNSRLLSDRFSFGTAVVGSMITMVRGSAELTQADALAKIKRTNKIIPSEKAAFKTMGKFASGAKFLGSVVGVVSIADHFTKAQNSFSNEGIYSINGWLNVGKIGIDGALMLIKSNPIVLTFSIGYGISDASGYLDYKH